MAPAQLLAKPTVGKTSPSSSSSIKAFDSTIAIAAVASATCTGPTGALAAAAAGAGTSIVGTAAMGAIECQ